MPPAPRQPSFRPDKPPYSNAVLMAARLLIDWLVEVRGQKGDTVKSDPRTDTENKDEKGSQPRSGQ
jgi:hypothetical protein